MDIVGLRLYPNVFFMHKEQKSARQTAGYTRYAGGRLALDWNHAAAADAPVEKRE